MGLESSGAKKKMERAKFEKAARIAALGTFLAAAPVGETLSSPTIDSEPGTASQMYTGPQFDGTKYEKYGQSQNVEDRRQDFPWHRIGLEGSPVEIVKNAAHELIDHPFTKPSEARDRDPEIYDPDMGEGIDMVADELLEKEKARAELQSILSSGEMSEDWSKNDPGNLPDVPQVPYLGDAPVVQREKDIDTV